MDTTNKNETDIHEGNLMHKICYACGEYFTVGCCKRFEEIFSCNASYVDGNKVLLRLMQVGTVGNGRTEPFMDEYDELLVEFSFCPFCGTKVIFSEEDLSEAEFETDEREAV